jgi:molybdopterin converting factor small subunit
VVGKPELALEVESKTTVASLIATLTTTYPGLVPVLTAAVLSLNLEYIAVDSTQALAANDELAIIPPISGG